MSDLLAGLAIRKPSITVDTADGSEVVGGGVRKVGLNKVDKVVSYEEDYEGTRKSVFAESYGMDDDKGTGVSGGGATKVKGEKGDTGGSTKVGGTKTDGRKGKGGRKKSEQKAETLFYLKEAPGLKHCCAPITTSSGGQRACGEKLVDGVCVKSSHSAVKTIDKLEFPALYCRAVKQGRGGESFFWDKQSYIKESELAEAPTPVLSSWITEKATKSEWTSRIHEFRSQRMMGKEVPATSRALDFTDDEEALYKKSYTPIKKERSAKGLEEIYEFVGEVGSEISAPDFSGAAVQGLEAQWEDPDDLLGVIDLIRVAVIEQMDRIDSVNQFATKSEKRAGARTNQIIEKLNSLVQVVSTLRRFLGSGKEFENLTGYSNVFDGLLGLHNITEKMGTELGSELRSEIKAEIELGSHGFEQEVGRLDTRLERAILKLEVMDVMMKDLVEKEIKELDEKQRLLGETQQVAGETFTKTMATLSQTLLPGLLEMQRDFYEDPSRSLTVRVRLLESGSGGGPATGADLLSSISHTGTADRQGFAIGGSQTQLNGIVARLDQLERENASLRQEVGELKSRSAAGPSAIKSTPDVEMIPRLLQRVIALELKDNAQIVVSGLAFGGVHDCKHFLTQQMTFDPATVFLGHDMVSLINNVLKEGESPGMSEVLTRDHNAMKGGFGNISVAALYASMQHAIPGPLAGSGAHPLPRINTFEKWDQQNGDTGIRYEIQRGVEHEVNQTLGWINSQLSTHPKAHILFSGLLQEAQTQWHTVATFLTDRRGVCMHQSGDQEESWKYPCEVVKGLLLELYKVRGVGSLRSNLKHVPIDDAARMMWGVLRCHQLMREFISHKFMGHPLLSGYSLNHLFRHRLTPKNLNPLTAKVEVIQREISAINTKLNKKKDK